MGAWPSWPWSSSCGGASSGSPPRRGRSAPPRPRRRRFAPAALPSGRPGPHDRPVTRTVRKPAVSPGTQQEPADRVPVVMMAYPALGHRPGHGDGHGDWYGYGYDYGQGQGNWDGLGEFNWHNGKTGYFLDPMSHPHDNRPARPPPDPSEEFSLPDEPLCVSARGSVDPGGLSHLVITVESMQATIECPRSLGLHGQALRGDSPAAF